MMKNISKKGIDLIKEFEGFRNEAYLCSGGKWTIGWGHTAGVMPNDIVTKDKAEDYLISDVKWAEMIVNSQIFKTINQNQFDALVSLVFNIGSGNFSSSTVKKVINANPNHKEAITKAWLMWDGAGSTSIAGLVRRRNAELELYFS